MQSLSDLGQNRRDFLSSGRFRLISLGEILEELRPVVLLSMGAMLEQSLAIDLEINLRAKEQVRAGLSDVTQEQWDEVARRYYSVIKTQATEAKKLFDEMDVAGFSSLLERLLTRLSEPEFDEKSVSEDLSYLSKKVKQHLDERAFFYLSAQDSKLYRNPIDGWDDVLKSFPSVQSDVIEARRCLTLDRTEAAIFHAMRVLEEGLYSLQRYVRVEKTKTDWGHVIDQIEAKIGDMERRLKGQAMTKSARSRLVKKLEFCQESARHFTYVKGSWRNYTMHTRRDRTPLDAREVLAHVQAIMSNLAARTGEARTR